MIEILSSRVVLLFSGPDSEQFLQRISTNDIVKQPYSYNYWLTNQGRYLFDFFTLKYAADSYFVEIAKARKEAFLAKILFYKLRSNFTIIDGSDTYRVIYSQEFLSKHDIVRQFPTVKQIGCYKDPRFSGPKLSRSGYRSIITGKVLPELDEQNLYMQIKYHYAIPDGNTDLEEGKSIPIEYGAEELGAIDYQKGCYVGQEVIARAKYQGVLRKKIYKLVADVDLNGINYGEPVLNNENHKIGFICSSFRNYAIGLLREKDYLRLNDLRFNDSGVNDLISDNPGITAKTATVKGIKVVITVPEWRCN